MESITASTQRVYMNQLPEQHVYLLDKGLISGWGTITILPHGLLQNGGENDNAI